MEDPVLKAGTRPKPGQLLLPVGHVPPVRTDNTRVLHPRVCER